MRKIWTVWDNYSCEAVGAYAHEDAALKAKADYIAALGDEDFYDDDVLVEAFDLHE